MAFRRDQFNLGLSINRLSPDFTNATILSPVTDLTFNLGGLTTENRSITPKRRLHLSPNTPNSSSRQSSLSSDGGFEDLPRSLESPSFMESYLQKENENPRIINRERGILRRIKSLPNHSLTVFTQIPLGKENVPVSSDNVPKSCYQDNQDTSSVTKSVVEDPDSQDSGLGADKEDCTEIVRPAFQFLEPHCLPPRRLRLAHEDSSLNRELKPRKCSCPTLMCGSNLNADCLSENITESTRSLLNNNEDDDGFLENLNDPSEDPDVSSSLSRLMTAPLLSPDFYIIKDDYSSQHSIFDQDTPKIKNSRCALSPNRHIGDDGKVIHFKRPDPPCDLSGPSQTKRRKSVCSDITFSSRNDDHERIHPKCILLQRCHSETEATIKRALQRGVEEPDLIGDFSKPFALPCVTGRQEDLKCISPETVYNLLNQNYSNIIDKFIIVDCRYPYEYEAGHIRMAKNIYTKEGIIKEFLSSPPAINCKDSRTVVIFHCEFSSERGPSLTRFLRNKDRNLNKECYPSLHYPELYVLYGGYKAFYESYKDLCEPQQYKPMLHKDHENDLKHFRAKSKSWNGDHKCPAVVKPGLKYL